MDKYAFFSWKSRVFVDNELCEATSLESGIKNKDRKMIIIWDLLRKNRKKM